MTLNLLAYRQSSGSLVFVIASQRLSPRLHLVPSRLFIVPTSYLSLYLFQLHQELCRQEHRRDHVPINPQRFYPRMAPHPRQTNSPLSSWYEEAMQWMFQNWPLEMGLQGGQNKLAWVCESSGRLRQIQEGDVRLMDKRRQWHSKSRRGRRVEKPDKQSREDEKNARHVQHHERSFILSAKSQWQAKGKKSKCRKFSQPGKTDLPFKTLPGQQWERSSKVQQPGWQRKTKWRWKESTGKKEEGRLNSTVYWWNVAGGLNSKFDSVKSLIIQNKPVAFFVLEANLKKNKCFRHLYILGYDLLVTDSDIAKTACYVRKGSGFRVTSTGDGNEVISIENDKSKVIGVYRPFKTLPGQTLKGNFDKLLKHLENETTSPKDILVGGDFNVEWVTDRDKAFKRDLEIWSLNNGLCQLIDVVTRKRVVKCENGSLRVEESTIDHIYATNSNIKVDVSEHPMSDHHILACQVECWAPKTRKWIRRDWRKYSEMSIHQYCSSPKGMAELIKLSSSQMDDPDILVENINRFLTGFINLHIPFRTNKTRCNQDIVDSGISSLKKKRDRALKKFYKTRDPDDHGIVRKLTKELKKRIKSSMNKKLQTKACSGNQKDFWNVINELSGKKIQEDSLELEIAGTICKKPEILCEVVADFFESKIKGLCDRTGLPLPGILDRVYEPHAFTMDELQQIIRKIKKKKSCGVDEIPMVVVVDAFPVLGDYYLKLFNLSLKKIPQIWKTALVKPLHKSGNKLDPANYRPISNLCSLEKIFEKLILNELVNFSDGLHQHGFKSNHSTTTAMLTLQEVIANKLDEKKNVVVYSLDLSAAFDMLRVDIFESMFRDTLPKWLLSVIVDFLTYRKCTVSVEGCKSTLRNVPLGCVQGSVLGPRLFNLYTSKIPDCFPHEIEIISYADDTYVVVYDDSEDNLIKKVETSINAHFKALLNLGMIVNAKKTEAVRFGRNQIPLTFQINGEPVTTTEQMKVLGVTFDKNLDWKSHVSKTISKVSRLTSGLKFLRKRLKKHQFLNAVTSQFYGLMYYGCQVWLGPHTKASSIRKLNAVHYRLLRLVENDWKKKKKRCDLDRIGRARPSLWGKYATGNLVIKILRDTVPTDLNNALHRTLFTERRKPLRARFFDSSKSRNGFQAIQNRLGRLFEILDFENYNKEISDISVRVLVKQALGMKVNTVN